MQVTIPPAPIFAAPPRDLLSEARGLSATLQEAFGIHFSIWDGTSGELLHGDGTPPLGDQLLCSEVVRRVADRRSPEIIQDADVVMVLAIPFELSAKRVAVGVVAIVTRAYQENEPLAEVSRVLGWSEADVADWIRRQETWPAHAALRMARAVRGQSETDRKLPRLADEIEKLSQNLSTTYEEICLLYGITQNLRISASDEELGRLAIDRLIECIPAEGLAIQYLPVADEQEVTYRARTESVLVTCGKCPVDNDEFAALVEALELMPQVGPFVANVNVTARSEWQFEQIRQLVIVPLVEGDNLYGWMAAFNHELNQEFGTVEANLLNSVGAILGIHTGNRELYRQQAEFLANVVRALTSAIDAKDPYTCGHSDRVARIAVRLARELKCGANMLNTLYMAGLLHDIGKIGIDDNVLRKPGRLTDAEFEHIRLHPELGYKILADLKQLADVLPVVLHHHEQWDGYGYPARLEGDQTPFLARITAVADAFDAMTSDRPYRKGMPVEKVEQVFREGAGKQWDPSVVDAYFRCRDDVVEISRRERANLSLNVEQWRD